MKTTLPQWIPRAADAPGVALAAAVGAVTLVLAGILPRSPYLSEILLAIVLGAVILNTPLRRLFQLALPSEEKERDRYAVGLRFTGRWVLRGAIILLGLKIEAKILEPGQIVLVGGVLLSTLPSTFLLVHALSAVLGVRRPFADLLAGGTMICGSTAVNALAPVTGARREEQGLAIATVFLFSLFALLVFQPLAAFLGLNDIHAGIWSGLAVNDLSSAVAVGKQMGGAADTMAAAAKSARILMLAPLMIFLSLVRRGSEVPSKIGKNALEQLPMFVLGFVALAVLRGVADRTFAGSPAGETWTSLREAGIAAAGFLMVTVAAGIGLHLEVGSLFRSGVRALAAGGLGSLWMAAVALTMVTLSARGASGAAALAGLGALGTGLLAFHLATRGDAQLRALRTRFESGAPLALAETIRLLDAFEREEKLAEPVLRKLVLQLHPSISELIPVRETRLRHGAGAHWLTYWQGTSGWALVAFRYEPGSATPIHAHSHRLIGKPIEGILEEFRFVERGAGALELAERRVLGRSDLVECDGLASPHLVRPIARQGAIDIQVRGPEPGQPGRRYHPASPLPLDALEPTARIPVTVEVDDRPGQAGEGPGAGRAQGSVQA